jgi:hypothetical protein
VARVNMVAKIKLWSRWPGVRPNVAHVNRASV